MARFAIPMVHPRGIVRARHPVARNAFAPQLLPHGRACYAGALNCSARPCVEFAAEENAAVLLLARSVTVTRPGNPRACRRAPPRAQRVVLGG